MMDNKNEIAENELEQVTGGTSLTPGTIRIGKDRDSQSGIQENTELKAQPGGNMRCVSSELGRFKTRNV